MDNVTHSIAGLLLAEATVQLRAARTGGPVSRTFHMAAAICGVVASNLPDADLFYAGAALGMGKLGYLLHHRGHTHTLVGAIAGGVLLWAIAMAWWRRTSGARRTAATHEERRALLWLCIVGALLHIALDFTNSYGVHPFWPIDDAWYYGDAVFIIEPWLWVAGLPPLVFLAVRRATRVTLAVLLAVILIAAWGVGMVPWPVALALTLGTGVGLAASARSRARTRLVTGLVAWLAVEGVFFAAAGAARGSLGGPAVRDIVLNPGVANPFCQNAIVIESDATRYVATTATVAPFPSLVPVARCPRSGDAPELQPSTRTSTDRVRWAQEWSAPRAELATLAQTNCEIAAALRFVRVPIWSRPSPTTIRFADLRYSRGGGGFAEIVVPERPTTCPRHVPNWTPPRADLLGSAMPNGH
jgi:inner membrane protein